MRRVRDMNRTLKTGLAAGAAAGGALAAWAFLVEPRWLEVTHPRIHLRSMPRPLEGLRIALITDLHARPRSLSVVRRACRAAMREQPDLIALAGDFAGDDEPGFRDVLEALSMLDAPLGVYAVPGNHDFVVGIERWHRQVGENQRIRDLTNAAVMKTVGGVRVCIAGVDDFLYGSPDLAALPPPEDRDFTILLAHNPDQAERSKRRDDQVDLILSGHTHGGQVRFPWVGAIQNPVERDDLYEQGLRRRPWTQVYISRGVGTVGMEVRFLCRPEVAILELTRAPRPSRVIAK